MRTFAYSALTLGIALGIGVVQLSACSNSADDCNATATCSTAGTSSGTAGKSGGGSSSEGGSEGAGTSSGTSGSSGTGGEGGGACEGDVSDDAECWASNDYGVFVSNQTGNDDTGNGTKEAPYATIGKGLDNAAGKKVFVCLGTTTPDYEEEIIIADSRDGSSIYGGFECEGWTWSATRKASLLSKTNVGLRAISLKKGLHIENLRITAPDATGSASEASSYGMFVTSSKGVVLTNVEIKAGKGARGADGAEGDPGRNGDESGAAPVGDKATCSVPDPEPAGGKWSSKSSCDSRGGIGGTASQGTANGQPGGAGLPTEHVSAADGIENGGLGEMTGGSEFDGKPGALGDNGGLGTAAPVAGTFSSSGFAVASGTTGTDGFAGQGGGGGGATKGTSNCYGASGGAGGMGGCGGKAGGAGTGGGASVGVFAWQSAIAIQGSTIVANTGGAGGVGGAGGEAGTGAIGGSGGASLNNGTDVIKRAGQGGPGGDGGLGGSGSGGTGGPSIAVVWHGSQPAYDAATTTLTVGAGGVAGMGGKRGQTAPNGSVGASQPELEVP